MTRIQYQESEFDDEWQDLDDQIHKTSTEDFDYREFAGPSERWIRYLKENGCKVLSGRERWLFEMSFQFHIVFIKP